MLLKVFAAFVTVLVTFGGRAHAESVGEPFGFADFSWAPGNYAPPTPDAKSGHAGPEFTPELRLDTAYHYEFSHPKDDTISGSSEVFRHNELQITHLGLGGDVNYKEVGLRFMTQFGVYSTTTPRNDASPAKGQWQLDNAYRYISEGYGTYHFNKEMNVQAGIFMSYIGLWSYYNFDNWTYQPSYVSSNTPWFFNGVRFQYFPNEKLKLEPWIVNGWQAYGKFNEAPGVGLQILWKPNGDWTVVGNQYYGADTLATPGRQRLHSDDSLMYKYYENQTSAVSKAAASITLDAGCEDGGGVACGHQYFLGAMVYNRFWFAHDHYAFTFGGGAINNPGRYLVLTPPVGGATAFSGTGYFPQTPGEEFHAWDMQIAADYMPTRNITFRFEYNHREADVPYFSGADGVTPPSGSTLDPTTNKYPGWNPNLSKKEDRVTAAMMVRL